MSFSLMDCQKTVDRADSRFTESGLRGLLLRFSFGFIDDLCTLVATLPALFCFLGIEITTDNQLLSNRKAQSMNMSIDIICVNARNWFVTTLKYMAPAPMKTKIVFSL